MNNIIKIVEIYHGLRVVIERKENGYFQIRQEEHRDIISQYTTTKENGWRDCLVTYAKTYDKAMEELNFILSHYKTKT